MSRKIETASMNETNLRDHIASLVATKPITHAVVVNGKLLNSLSSSFAYGPDEQIPDKDVEGNLKQAYALLGKIVYKGTGLQPTGSQPTGSQASK